MFHPRVSLPKRGNKCTPQMMDSTGIILACRCPRCMTLDTRYRVLLASGVAGMGENNSIYARCAGAVAKDGNSLVRDLLGS